MKPFSGTNWFETCVPISANGTKYSVIRKLGMTAEAWTVDASAMTVEL